MKYLAFDIECADGGKATICSFGYVIADEQFRILKKEDIVINPQGAFYLTGRGNRPDVQLAYSIERFRRAPSFSHFYNHIKSLLENEKYIVIGHSVADDVAYLNKACKRYKLPALKFSYFEVNIFFLNVQFFPFRFPQNIPLKENRHLQNVALVSLQEKHVDLGRTQQVVKTLCLSSVPVL